MFVPPDNFGLVEEGIYRCAKLDPLNYPFLETLNLTSLILLDAEKPQRTLLNFVEETNTKAYHIGGSKMTVIEKHKENDPETSSNANANANVSGSGSGSVGASGVEGASGVSETGSGSGTGSGINVGSRVNTSSSGGGNESNSDSANSNNYKMEDWMIIKPNLIVEIFELLLNKKTHNVLLVDKTETVIGILRKLEKWSFSSIINEYRLHCGIKSNYFTETFLELIRVQLVSHDEFLQKQHEKEIKNLNFAKIHKINSNENFKKITSMTISNPMNISKNNEKIQLEQDDETLPENDDLLSLSASPQIPKNLLILAEMRKQKKKSNRSKDGGIEEENINNFSNNITENDKQKFKKYLYYQPLPSNYFNTSTNKKSKSIKIILPKDEDLPNWFIQQRDRWEALTKHV
ncbi:hypothetical protein PACTADRAFT_35752 [Pachysolen tannophilus NRRL Y-2460]|uniref:Protein OCA4 n=1 Tax=Pachysolen tannophilus NRRL Y-2460 TaxID=669874 RepID=A0A1E4TQJ0_PACTA|nr:hypothetical protein PACTADRAFT_35752 [Pachysolen tannophilus NRRL Y-2460]